MTTLGGVHYAIGHIKRPISHIKCAIAHCHRDLHGWRAIAIAKSRFLVVALYQHGRCSVSTAVCSFYAHSNSQTTQLVSGSGHHSRYIQKSASFSQTSPLQGFRTRLNTIGIFFALQFNIGYCHNTCHRSTHHCNLTLHKPTSNSLDGFFPFLVFMLLLFFTRKSLYKTARNTIVFLCHHHLELCTNEYVSSSLLLLAFAPNGALQHVCLATRKVFIVFFTLLVLSSLVGDFHTSSSLLVCSSSCSVLNQLL